MSAAGQAPADSLPERLAHGERWVTLAALALTAAAGLFVTLRVGDILMLPTAPAVASTPYAALLFIMWWTMMMAMMLPSAAPAILIYCAMSRRFAEQGASAVPVALFAGGYAAIWTVFSVAAIALQLLTRTLIPLTGMMAVTSATIGGIILIAAGAYQLTPLKHACLRKCQSPLMFFAHNWRPGRSGALRMGLSHGLYCLGCCWVLMGLLFYGGVMEPTWIIGIAAYVAAEKLIPAGSLLSRLAGVGLIVWGLSVLYPALN